MKYTPLLALVAFSMPLLAPIAIAAPGIEISAPKKKSAKEVVFTKLFNQADADGDHLLNETEFGNSYGASERPVVTEIRFDVLSSSDLDRARSIAVPVITLEDFIAANGGRKIKPNKFDIFFYADDDHDGFLSPLEFFATRISSASTQGSSMKAFNRLDKNDDGEISMVEYGIAIKN